MADRTAAGLERFDPANTEFHRICPEDVASAAGWEMSLEGILHFTCEDPLVAYNAVHSAEVMLKASVRLNLDLPAKDFYCAQDLAQDQIHLPRPSINDALAALKLPSVPQPEPGANAAACAKIVMTIARMRTMVSLEELWHEPAATLGRKPQGRRRKQSWNRRPPDQRSGYVGPCQDDAHRLRLEHSAMPAGRRC